MDEGKLSGSLLLDLSAGFDVIGLDLLLKKLKLYGFKDEALCWFESYLKERFQCVQVESAFSPFLQVKWGVPQGSILGPLLFLIFINELPALVETADNVLEEEPKEDKSTIVVFADDNTPINSEKDPETLQRKLQSEADLITNWFGINKMIVSGDKTKLVVVGTHANRESKLKNKTLCLNVDGHPTSESDSEKLLGIIINKFGTWRNHLHGDEENIGLLKELSKRIGMLRRLRNHIPDNRFKMIVSGIWTSKLLYGISVWGSVWGIPGRPEEKSINMTKADMRKLQVLQNSTLRLILKERYDKPTVELLSESKSLSVNQLVAFNMLSQVFKVKESQLPVYHHNRLFGHLNRDQNVTRSISISYKLCQSRESFFHFSSSLWNATPPAVRNSLNLASFKTNARKWVLSNIPSKI